MKTILTFGVFDMLHIGHIALFKRLADYVSDTQVGGGKVIVAIQDNDYILKYKPESKIVYSLEEKVFMLEAIRYIDEIIVYKDVDVDVKKIDFDILAVGPDQKHEGFQRAMKWCRENGKEVVVMPRTEGISSTLLKGQYFAEESSRHSSGTIIELDELKKIQLDILTVVDRFCRDNGIKYSMGCGTMLGAARHKGYIPWDEDIDIYLLRDEYEKLIKHFPEELDDVKISSLQRDNRWDRAYAKAYDERTEMQDAGNKYRIGVGIDIYPIDRVPESENEWKKYNKRRRLYQRLFEWKNSMILRKGRALWKYAFLPFAKLLLLPFPSREIAFFLERYSMKFKNSDSTYVFECCQGMLQKNRFKRTVLEETIDMPFEGRVFLGMKNYDEYLTCAYGDWRKLPPVEKRIGHHVFTAWWK